MLIFWYFGQSAQLGAKVVQDTGQQCHRIKSSFRLHPSDCELRSSDCQHISHSQPSLSAPAIPQPISVQIYKIYLYYQMNQANVIAIQVVEIDKGSVENFLKELTAANQQFLTHNIKGINYTTGGFIMQSQTPVFQLTTCWNSEADFKTFVTEKAFYKESLARMQVFSSKPISMRAVQLEEPFQKPEGGKCLEIFTTVMAPNLAQEFRSHLNSDLLANARKAQGFIRSTYGKSLQQQNDKFMVVTLILWDNIQCHQQFAKSQPCIQFGDSLKKLNIWGEVYDVTTN